MAKGNTAAKVETNTGTTGGAGNTGLSGNAGRVFKTVNGKETGGDQKLGELNFVRFGQLAEQGITGVVAEGIFEGTVANRFDDQKLDYKIRKENGDLTIVNSAGSLASQMKRVAQGSYVRITYKGKQPAKSGKYAGKPTHSVIVEIAE